VLSREAPERLFIGVDANAAALRERSGRAARARRPNVLYVRAAVEDLPPELVGAADRVTVVLPWGSLLAAVARPSVPVLHGIRSLCQPGGGLTVVGGIAPTRDAAECLRLGLPALDPAHLLGPVKEAYRAAGLDMVAARPLTPAQLACWPSTWARRLARDPARSWFQIEARAR
jgi:16S rRNA (adenine(1408)-N(1))-methyltransferase